VLFKNFSVREIGLFFGCELPTLPSGTITGIVFRTGLTQKSSDVVVIPTEAKRLHELPLRQTTLLRQFCVSPIEVGSLSKEGSWQKQIESLEVIMDTSALRVCYEG
jgi:hypothetical protein